MLFLTKNPILDIPKSLEITKPGHYRFKQNIIASRKDNIGIKITAPNVTLDFNGYSLIANHDLGPINFGLHAAYVDKLYIVNGTICGFYHGLIAAEVQRSIICNMLFEDIKYIAINLTGENNVLHNNRINNLDFSYPKNQVDYYLIGIKLDSINSQITNNIIKNQFIPDVAVNNHVEYVGILAGERAKNCLIEENQFLNYPNNRVKSYGVWAATGSQLAITNNHFSNIFFDIASMGIVNLQNNRSDNDAAFIQIQKKGQDAVGHNKKLIKELIKL